jgi:hypothetical protein
MVGLMAPDNELDKALDRYVLDRTRLLAIVPNHGVFTVFMRWPEGRWLALWTFHSMTEAEMVAGRIDMWMFDHRPGVRRARRRKQR